MNERIKDILDQPAFERLKDWASIGPVQMSTVEGFAEMIILEYAYDVMDLTAAPEHVVMAAKHWGVEL